MKAKKSSALLATGGLFAGAVAWSLHQQISYIAASWICGRDTGLMLTFFAMTAAILLAGAFLSWRFCRFFPTADRRLDENGRPRHFLVSVSLLAAALFFFAIILQTAASFFLPGCR
jgi:hypothetical protein